MFCPTLVCVIASCYFIAVAGNNGVANMLRASSSSSSSSSLTKAQKKKIAKNVMKTANDQVKKVQSSSNFFQQKSKKEIEEIALAAFYPYDSDFSGGWWIQVKVYQDTTTCSGAAYLASDISTSFCYSIVAVTPGDTTYNSAARLFNSDCSQATIGFYTNSACSGAPAMQSNTETLSIPATCQKDGKSSQRFQCTQGKIGNPYDADVGVLTMYEQTLECSGKTYQDTYFPANVCATTGATSNQLIESTYGGPAVASYACANCDCAVSATINLLTTCAVESDDNTNDDAAYYGDDDDDDDDDDGFVDDGMFTSFDENGDGSTKWSYENSAIGDVVNVGLSLALVVAVSFGLLI